MVEGPRAHRWTARQFARATIKFRKQQGPMGDEAACAAALDPLSTVPAEVREDACEVLDTMVENEGSSPFEDEECSLIDDPLDPFALPVAVSPGTAKSPRLPLGCSVVVGAEAVGPEDGQRRSSKRRRVILEQERDSLEHQWSEVEAGQPMRRVDSWSASALES